MSSKILVVDDEARYARLMEATLLSEGYEVVKCYDGSRAITLADEQTPDLVLMDVMMPVMDGNEFCRKVKTASQSGPRTATGISPKQR